MRGRLPFALPIAWMGALFGRELARQNRRNLAPATWAVLAIPSLALLESRLPAPPPVHEVVSSVDVAAPPEIVWRHVVSFDDLPPLSLEEPDGSLLQAIAAKSAELQPQIREERRRAKVLFDIAEQSPKERG